MVTDSSAAEGLVKIVRGVATTVIAAAAVWVAVSVGELQRNSAVTKEQVAFIRAQVSAVQKSLTDLYPASDAKRELRRIDAELADHETRIRRLEQSGAD